MPISRIRLVDARPFLDGRGAGWIKKSSEFKSALQSMREKNIAPHEVLEIKMPDGHNTKSSAVNFSHQINKWSESEKLGYTAKSSCE